MLDHESDLIAMARQHNPRLALRMQDGHHVSVAVSANFFGVILGPSPNEVLDGALKTGGAGGGQETL
jgi:hypothetical protein